MIYSPILKGDRPNAPSSWSHLVINQTQSRQLQLVPSDAFLVSYALTWHHNIPWKTLRDSWNIVYTFCSDDVVKKLFYLYWSGNKATAKPGPFIDKLLAIRNTLITKENAASSTFGRWIERLSWQDPAKDTDPDGQLNHFSAELRITTQENEQLYSMVAWQKWNIVEGPKEAVRVEDPGSDAFDDFRFVDRGFYSRFQAVFGLNDALEQILADYDRVHTTACDLKGIVAVWNRDLEAVLDVANSLSNEPIVYFNKDWWKTVKFGNNDQTQVNTVPYYWMAKKQSSEQIYSAPNDFAAQHM